MITTESLMVLIIASSLRILTKPTMMVIPRAMSVMMTTITTVSTTQSTVVHKVTLAGPRRPSQIMTVMVVKIRLLKTSTTTMTPFLTLVMFANLVSWGGFQIQSRIMMAMVVKTLVKIWTMTMMVFLMSMTAVKQVRWVGLRLQAPITTPTVAEIFLKTWMMITTASSIPLTYNVKRVTSVGFLVLLRTTIRMVAAMQVKIWMTTTIRRLT